MKVSHFIKYILVGLLNTVFGFVLFAGLLFLGLHYSIAALLATIIGVLFNFKTYGNFVFKTHGNTKLLRFILVYALSYLINVGLLRICTGIGMDAYLSGAILALPMSGLTYCLNRKLVFGVTR